MKKIALSALVAAMVSTSAMADMTSVFMPDSSVSGLYVGAAYSQVKNDTSLTYTDIVWSSTNDNEHNTPMFQIGWKYNKYFAFEGRYWNESTTLNSTYADGTASAVDTTFSAYGLYLKPMYPVTKTIDVYALLGYSNTSYDMTEFDNQSRPVGVHGLDGSGFSWGIGASLNINENFSAFVDYTRISDDDQSVTVDRYISATALGTPHTANADITSDSINIGVSYKF